MMNNDDGDLEKKIRNSHLRRGRGFLQRLFPLHRRCHRVSSLERSLKYILIGIFIAIVIIATILQGFIINSNSSFFHHLFLASEDLPNGPALVVFQWQDLTLCRCPRVVLAPVPPEEEGC